MKAAILSFIVALCIFQSCEETEEGCLDLLANNYAFSAVNACDSCCTYPKLNVSFKCIYDSLSYNYRDTIVIAGQDSIILSRMQIVFSEFILKNNTKQFTIIDSLSRAGSHIKDDFAYYQSNSSRTLGTIKFSDTITSLIFCLGFHEQKVDEFKPFETINQDSHLDLALDSLYLNETGQYLMASIDVEFVEEDTTKTYVLPNLDDVNILEFSVDKTAFAGQDFSLALNINLNQLLRDMDWSSSDEDIILALSQKIFNVISVE